MKPTKGLPLSIAVSITLHVAILAIALGGAAFFFRHDLPLPGGGGGYVSVEIIGNPGGGEKAENPPNTKEKEITVPPTPTIPKRSNPSPEAMVIKKKNEEKQKLTNAVKIGSGGDPLQGSSASSGHEGQGQGPIGTGPGSGTDDGKSIVLAQIRTLIERAKRYPELARRMGITGSPIVSFRIDAEGKAQDVTLKKSSGQEILDEEAVATVKRVRSFPVYEDKINIGINFHLVEP